MSGTEPEENFQELKLEKISGTKSKEEASGT